ncbi:hypothetical protein [Actinomadura gamaensis]|uniref:Uncharacterized protein n=1 Tax=Actinomadura gamaensis TaxID=1763541 RepID=A0ABV9TV16_9ACTN
MSGIDWIDPDPDPDLDDLDGLDLPENVRRYLGALSRSSAEPSRVPEARLLAPGERAMIEDGPELAELCAGIAHDGFSLACVADRRAVEVLSLWTVTEVIVTDEQTPWYELDFGGDEDVLGITDVPGGCVIAQPWGDEADSVLRSVTAGTFGYGMYANPKSGDQGRIAEDGEIVRGDLHPGHRSYGDVGGREVLAAVASGGSAIAHCLLYAGLRPDSLDFLEYPDAWVRVAGGQGR